MLGRLFALRLVASAYPEQFQRAGTLPDVRRALLEERWADAVLLWMDATGSAVDGYPDEVVWTDARLDTEFVAFELRLTRIFTEPAGG